MYEYTVKTARSKGQLARLINRMARDGWEPIEQSRRGMLQWGPGNVDVTFRRPKTGWSVRKLFGH